MDVGHRRTVVAPSVDLARQMADGTIEGLVIKDKTSTYRDGSRAGWFKIKDRSRYEREAWRFDRRWLVIGVLGGAAVMRAHSFLRRRLA